MARMWLSVGMFSKPNRVWQLERPCPVSRCRWCARKEGLWVKNTEKAAKLISAMVYRRLAPVRLSGSASQQRRTEPSRVSRRPMASVEQRVPSRTTARARVPERHVNPTGPASAQNENCCVRTVAFADHLSDVLQCRLDRAEVHVE